MKHHKRKHCFKTFEQDKLLNNTLDLWLNYNPQKNLLAPSNRYFF